MTDEIMLDSKSAIQYVMDEFGYTSYYSISKELTKHGVTVQPIQISNYHKANRAMSEKVAAHFYDVFGIEIADAYHSDGRPTEW